MNCRECEFYKKETETQGWCRRKAPVVSEDVKARWPVVDSKDWCGEFQESMDAVFERVTTL